MSSSTNGTHDPILPDILNEAARRRLLQPELAPEDLLIGLREAFGPKVKTRLIREAVNIVVKLVTEQLEELIWVTSLDQREKAMATPLAAPRFAPEAWFYDPPPPREFLLTLDGQGFMPAGRACGLSAPGGVGKSYVAVQLALSVATGRPLFDRFDVPHRGRTMMIMAEEDEQELHRRLFHASRHMDTGELANAAARVAVFAGAGLAPTPLLRMRDDDVETTEHFDSLVETLNDTAEDPWRLVILDPVIRLAGIESEADNRLATVLVQHLEILAATASHPTVLAIGHSSKYSQIHTGQADARGVAGYVDALRWHASMQHDGPGCVMLNPPKTNYGPAAEPMMLVRTEYGPLRAATDSERTEAEERKLEAAADRTELRKDAKEKAAERRVEKLVNKVVEVVRVTPGMNKTDLAAAVGGNAVAAHRAIASALVRGLVVNRGQNGGHSYHTGP